MPTPDIKDHSKPTAAGCLLMLLSLAAIVALAIPLIRWRDPATGEALPRFTSILIPIVAGATVFGLGTTILKMLGLPIATESRPPIAEDETPPGDKDASSP